MYQDVDFRSSDQTLVVKKASYSEWYRKADSNVDLAAKGNTIW